ncbi:FTR1 family iron permease [Peribacillus muralis]|uniref:FTR1 family iron permease n=1 Tax=Peribacillus muralis TaxID=264697 RepID=UPI001F4DFF4A|nr:FTR1 family protein [Peribacillus muralis]MCK1995120.1 FTR1 family iron permease [Peribacillus muralis]MCK2015654.1 FTR1 family iron permease [Peribacillus muralis]
MNVFKWKSGIVVLLVSFLIILPGVKMASAGENHDQLFVYIGDSLMKLKSGEVEQVSKNINSFEKDWKTIKTDSKDAKKVSGELQTVKSALKEGASTADIKKRLSALSSALVTYDAKENPVDKTGYKERLQALLPLIDELDTSITAKDFDQANVQYANLLNQWTDAEVVVREKSVATYGEIETKMAFVRIAITQDPPDQEKGKSNVAELKGLMEDFLAGKVEKGSKKSTYSLADVTQLLQGSVTNIEKDDIDSAVDRLNEILTIWPNVEGEVSTRDSKLYSDMETKVPTAISLLQSKNIKAEEAKAIVSDLYTRLLPLVDDTSYTTWDAALILLREGLEALLIVATLLSFLTKIGQVDKQKWIWAGVGAGLVASSILAVIINIVFSQITAASSREYIEGITGIMAVLMMLTIGIWLHSKSNVHAWNRYISKQMNQAIATGSIISFALISFLSIFREGAETIIFYAGMAPYMEIKQLLSGILLAFLILVVIGFIMLRYSVKLPMTIFFKVATLLIYALAFKILGVSIHSLQVSQVIPTNTISSFPFVEAIGLYPTIETLVPQAALLLLIIFAAYWVKKSNSLSG